MRPRGNEFIFQLRISLEILHLHWMYYLTTCYWNVSMGWQCSIAVQAQLSEVRAAGGAQSFPVAVKDRFHQFPIIRWFPIIHNLRRKGVVMAADQEGDVCTLYSLFSYYRNTLFSWRLLDKNLMYILLRIIH